MGTMRRFLMSASLSPESGAGSAVRWSSASEAKRKMRQGEATREAGERASQSTWPWLLTAAFIALSVAMFLGRRIDSEVLRFVRRFDTINAYGAFAVGLAPGGEAVLEDPGAQQVWWTRTETGPYCPPVMLGPDEVLQRAF